MDSSSSYEMQKLVDKVDEFEYKLTRVVELLEQISDGFFSLNLHVGADVDAWTGGGRAASVGRNDDESLFAGRGRVKWFNQEEGFGLLVDGSGGPDVFFIRGALDSGPYTVPSVGQRADFQAEITERGPMALRVTLLP